MLNQLSSNPGARKQSKRFGRGIGSGKGKTCGRGGKGQTARSGVAVRGFEGGQMPIYIRLPIRGFNNINKIKYEILNFSTLRRFVEEGILNKQKITIEDLRKVGVFKGKTKKLKLIGLDHWSFAGSLEVHAISKRLRSKIEADGGNVNIVK